MKRLYLSRNYKYPASAGGKAKTDIERYLTRMGFQNIGIEQSTYRNKVIDFALNFAGFLYAIVRMPRNAILFLQYPTKKYYSLLCLISHLKNNKVVTLIHDLGCFRRCKLKKHREIHRLNQSDYIIATNKNMQQWLINNGCTPKTGSLDIWDYYTAGDNRSIQKNPSTSRYIVNYAGGLSRRKNNFLYHIHPDIHSYLFHLYGSGYTGSNDHPNFIYKGYVACNDFITNINGDFGLVWDGDSLDTCSGNFGDYLRYNTPHKISFYIRAHLPVIIWKEAAMAHFIEQENIGFTIASVKELDGILANFPIDRYNEMKRNAIAMSRRLKEGYYIGQAIEEAEKNPGT